MSFSRCISHPDIVTDIVVRARTYSGTFSRSLHNEPQSMPIRARAFSETLVRNVPNKTVAPHAYYVENKFVHVGKVITSVLNKPLQSAKKNLKQRKKKPREDTKAFGKELVPVPSKKQKLDATLAVNIPSKNQCVYLTRSYLWTKVRGHFFGKKVVLYRQPKAIADAKLDSNTVTAVAKSTKRGPNKFVQKLRNSSLRKLKLPIHQRRKSRLVTYIRSSKLSRMTLPHSKKSYKCRMVQCIKDSSIRQKLGLVTCHRGRRSRVVQMIRESPLSKISLPVF